MSFQLLKSLPSPGNDRRRNSGCFTAARNRRRLESDRHAVRRLSVCISCELGYFIKSLFFAWLSNHLFIFEISNNRCYPIIIILHIKLQETAQSLCFEKEEFVPEPTPSIDNFKNCVVLVSACLSATDMPSVAKVSELLCSSIISGGTKQRKAIL